MASNQQTTAKATTSKPLRVDKRETFHLTKPVSPSLPIDHSALEELHLGPIPCVRVREAPFADLDTDHQAGSTKVFNGKLTVLNIPKGFYRIDSPDWNEKMSTSYGKEKDDTPGQVNEPFRPLVEGDQGSHFLFLLYELKSGEAPVVDKYSTYDPDFCFLTAGKKQPEALLSEGRDNACDNAFKSADSLFVCQYSYFQGTDYTGTPKGTELRDILTDRYFERIPTPQQQAEGYTRQSMSAAPLKMLATLIPGRGVVWLPVIGKKPADYEDFLYRDKTKVMYHKRFLDGPNVFIGKFNKNKPWKP